MKDRNVQFPHRYQMVPVAGQESVYDFVPVPGTITEPGTPINKATLLTDETAALYGLTGDDATVDGALVGASDKVGDIKIFGGEQTNPKWLLCNGALLRRSDYPDLYNVVGSKYMSDDRDIIERVSGFDTTQINSVKYGNGLWVAVGDSGKIATSTNGITWTIRTSNAGTASLLEVAYGNGMWIAVGESGTIVTSPNGITWTKRTSGAGSAGLYSVCYGGGKWMISVDTYSRIMDSIDGITWNYNTTNHGDSGHFRKLSYGNGKWVYVSSTNTLVSSNDGATWVAGTAFPSSGSNASIAYGNGLWVIVAGNSIMTSTNGSTWANATTTKTISRVGIAYASGVGYGRWLACGNGIQASKNGIEWSDTLINSDAYSLRCAGFNGVGLWVVAGVGGKLITIQEVNEAEEFYLMDYTDKFDYIYIKGAK